MTFNKLFFFQFNKSFYIYLTYFLEKNKITIFIKKNYLLKKILF